MDLQLRGWGADIRLWLTCRHLPVAALGENSPIWRPVHLAAVTEALGEYVEAKFATPLLELLGTGFRSDVYGQFLIKNKDAGLMAVETDQLRRVVQSLTVLRRQACCPSLVANFCAWLRRNLRGGARADLLGAMHLLGSTAATEALLLEASDPTAEPDVRRRAAALALVPTRSALLSFDEVAHA